MPGEQDKPQAENNAGTSEGMDTGTNDLPSNDDGLASKPHLPRYAMKLSLLSAELVEVPFAENPPMPVMRQPAPPVSSVTTIKPSVKCIFKDGQPVDFPPISTGLMSFGPPVSPVATTKPLVKCIFKNGRPVDSLLISRGGEVPRPPISPVVTTKPSVKCIFKDGQPVVSVKKAEESMKSDVLPGVVDLSHIRDRRPNSSSAVAPKVNRLEEKTFSQRVSETVLPVPAEAASLNEVIGSKFIGLLAPANDSPLAYEKREVKQKDSQWLPLEMQASEDEEEFVEDFADKDQLPKHVVVPSVTKAPSNERAAAPDNIPSKRLSREFLISCYANPAAKSKPDKMSQFSAALGKPIEDLLHVLKKATATPGETEKRGRSRSDMPRNEMGRSYTEAQEIRLHKTQDPYFVKGSSALSAIELKTRQFRSLMNKITENNSDKIIGRMADLDLNKEEMYRPILDVIFDKAIQEPDFCHLYAKVCKFLTKILRLSKVREDGGTEKVTFKHILVAQVQETFQKRLTDVEAYIKVENDLAVTTSNVAKKRLREEMDEIARHVKRKHMGNIKFIGHLFKLDVFNMKLIELCVDILLDENIVEWQYESLCNLMFVVGSTLDKNNPSFVDNIFAKMRALMPGILDNRIKFMFADVFDMRANGWKLRKPGDKEATSTAAKASGPVLSSRLSGMSSNQRRYQRVGAVSRRSGSPDRRTHTFENPEVIDRVRHFRSSKGNAMQKTKQPVAAAKSPAKPAPLPHATARTIQAQGQKPIAVSRESKMHKLRELLEVKGFYKFEHLEKAMSQINEIMEKDWKLWKALLPIMYEAILGYDEESCMRFGRLMFTAFRNGMLAEEDLLESVKTMWVNADDIKLDVPFFYPLMGATLGVTTIYSAMSESQGTENLTALTKLKRADVLNDKFPDSIKLLPRLYAPIARKPGAGQAIGRMLELACKHFGNENVKRQVDRCGFVLKKYCTQEELHNLLKTKFNNR